MEKEKIYDPSEQFENLIGKSYKVKVGIPPGQIHDRSLSLGWYMYFNNSSGG
jgi:hypothetical protein